MILAEEALKMLDGFLLCLKRLNTIFKYKYNFIATVYDFTTILNPINPAADGTQQTSCFHNFILPIITMIIAYSMPTKLFNSNHINSFWTNIKLPKDCSLPALKNIYFRQNLAPFFDIAGTLYISPFTALTLVPRNRWSYRWCRVRILRGTSSPHKAIDTDPEQQKSMLQPNESVGLSVRYSPK